jgi:predicted metal-dependent peptidase
MLIPEVDWAEQLREYVSAICVGKGESTWRKPNRRWLGQDIYMPSQVAESIGNIVVAIDTSGSISGEAITRALSELVGICDNTTPERVDLIYWDHKVAGHEVYFEDGYAGMINSTKPKGGGGTSIESVFGYLKEFKLTPVLLVVITDLYFSFPADKPDYPILWVAVDNAHTVPPYGTTIRLR